jgi:predicted Rossmann fold flavoprotein
MLFERQSMSKVIVIGAGAAGLIAAGFAAQNGNEVILLERNPRPARKLMITGKGRCNVTNFTTLINDLIEAVPVNGRFLYSAFTRFMPADTMDFFEELGVPLIVERGDRVFPESQKAVDIVDALVKFAKQNKVKIIVGRAKHFNTENGIIKAVITEDNEEVSGDNFIVATGGMSYPLTGSTGDGYSLAKELGHTIITPKPSLVPLEISEEWYADLQGLSLRNVSISIRNINTYTEIYKDFGEMLFTHFGVSGPIILSASSHIRDCISGQYIIELDLKPALSHEQLDARILRDIAEFANKTLNNALVKLLPKALIPVVLDLADLNPNIKANQLTKEMRSDLVETLKCMTMTIEGFRPIEEAIVTSGGVSVNEIDPKTMQSKLCENLYFAGEVIDVDAYTGGYNLQIAFSTGKLAGSSIY